MNPVVFALIPARGGSKGIPRKNLAMLGSRSLLTRCIHTVQTNAGIPCFVSTEDAEIADEATRSGAAVISRPSELAADDTTTEAVMAHAVEFWMHGAEDGRWARPTHIALVQCTAPFMLPDDVRLCIAAATDGSHDAAFAAAKWHGKLWTRGANGSLVGANHDHAEVRQGRQRDLQPQYIEAGSAYVVSVDGFRASGTRFGTRPAIVEVPARRAFEVDEPWELEAARRILG